LSKIYQCANIILAKNLPQKRVFYIVKMEVYDSNFVVACPIYKTMSAPRLLNFNYRGFYAYSITCNCNENKKNFIDASVVNKCVSILRQVANEHNFYVYAYCFMHNHLHLLLASKNERSDLRKAIKLFKQKTGYWFQNKYYQKLWQRSFYDHILRKEEDLDRVARYILENPTRKRLTVNFWNYPFSGSFIMHIKDLIY